MEVDIEEGPVRLVVEGRITYNPDDASGYQFIRLSTTAPYFENQAVPAVSGALVAVTNIRTNRRVPFTESDIRPGIYETNDLMAEVGEEYRLEIEYNGDQYEAIERLLPVASIDRIFQEFEEETLVSDEGIKVKVDYTDPIDERNFYHWQTYRNDTLLVTADPGNVFNLISSDEFYNGLTITGFGPSRDFAFRGGDMAEVRQYALSESAYIFYRNYYEQVVGVSPGLGDVVPATLRGNIQNLSNPDLYPLGYFEASEVAIAHWVVQ
ncbi:MAG: DUF4249 domain-containing protein [Roseivirga sp.]